MKITKRMAIWGFPLILLSLLWTFLPLQKAFGSCATDADCTSPTRICYGSICQSCSHCVDSTCCVTLHGAACGWSGSACYNDHSTPELPEGMSWTFFLGALPLIAGYFLYVYRKQNLMQS